jgi:hypothetical protein
MTGDNSIWAVPYPSDLKRNENVFIIGAQVAGGAFTESWPLHRSAIPESMLKILCHFTLGGICCD